MFSSQELGLRVTVRADERLYLHVVLPLRRASRASAAAAFAATLSQVRRCWCRVRLGIQVLRRALRAPASAAFAALLGQVGRRWRYVRLG
ncbi:hypothetical protein FRC09_016124 [Ceratobasidium sp. 395]|nr:hypothetical protein FRC09_016124 [Ceratobasidium sp. 395]